MPAPSDERIQKLHAKFSAALDLLDEERRQPDRWEEESLFYALAALACGLHLVADVELEVFARLPQERSKHAAAALEQKPARFDKAALRAIHRRLMELGASPVFEMLPTADQLEALGRARLFVLEQQVGDERVGLALPAEGRGLAMAWHELDVVAQRP